ncbi:SPOR domain-containing protein [Maribellus sp. YY47]|uniref:SPOR domain-containing protein n=1 Tax=Maribellus sp. YY47 TaxID=2929486 RepID=UPI002001B356|nr:SPOR domain-containing protein [Maribellus sp. YY47]MCK3684045.1 SPOR domain-containing protein [Maribellus sp. YY47]
MELRKINILLTTSILLLFAVFPLFAGAQKNPLVEAILRFDEGKYAEAESLLAPQIAENPDNLMINYYYGACRTENGHYGANEINYLLKGSMGESPLKTNYYLGVQYQAMLQWDKALSCFEKFAKTSDQNEQASLGLSEKIQQCKDHFSPVEVKQEDIAPVPLAREEEPKPDSDSIIYTTPADTNAPDTLNQEEELVPEPKTKPDKTNRTAPINFDINSEMTYIDTSNFQTIDGLQAYLQWKKLRHELDSVTRQLDDWRQKYAEANTASFREALGQKIVDAEGGLFNLQRDTRESLQKARQTESDYWNTQPEEIRNEFKLRLRELATSYNQPEPAKAEVLDTSLIISAEILPDAVEPTPQAATEQEDELVYKIQLGAYSRGLPAYIKRQFDKLSLIRKIDQYTDEKGVVVYTTGSLSNYEDALKMQTQVRREGIQDAFVVPYFNGKRITLNEAKKLEAEQ